MKGERSTICKLGRYMKAPIRILSKARDFYVKSLTDCSGRMQPYAGVMGYPAGVVPILPKSFSVNSSRSNEDEDLRVLMQTLSKTTSRREEETSGAKGLPKTFSVGGIGRIDEDKPCCFAEDFKVDTEKMVYSRSRSYAVTSTKRG